jgi:serine/threonine protein kinase
MSKSITGLKPDINSHKSSIKSSTYHNTSLKLNPHKSFDKSSVSKLVPKLQLSSTMPREIKEQKDQCSTLSSRANLKCNSSSLNSSRVLRENQSRQPSFPKKSQQKDCELKMSSFPMTSSSALRSFKSHLTLWEQGEILDYNQVYFLGLKSGKSRSFSGFNNGFDDDRNDYRALIGDHIAYRYEILQTLGKGSFGQVFKVMDHKEKELQALKIIRNKPRFHQQGTIEVKVLQQLKNSDKDDKNHVIHLKEAFSFREHLCITFEILSINLYEFLKSNSFNGLSLSLIQRFTAQLLQGLSLAKDQKIIHCDLKPENILLKQSSKSCVKIIDFGSSCYEDQRVFSYIQSRFYRAPEVILGMAYSTAIDMWSLGCILVELYTGVPLFPGENELDQLLCMMEVLGLPPENLLKNASRAKIFFENDLKPKIIPNSRGKKRLPASRVLKEVLVGTERNFQEFVSRCLEWDPLKRLTPELGLAHAWIKALEKVQVTPRSRRMSTIGNFAGVSGIPANVSTSVGGYSTRHSKTNSFVFV